MGFLDSFHYFRSTIMSLMLWNFSFKSGLENLLNWKQFWVGKMPHNIFLIFMAGNKCIRIFTAWRFVFFFGRSWPLLLVDLEVMVNLQAWQRNTCEHFLGGDFNYFYFHPYLGKWSNLTNIFQMGWNHQLDFWWSGFSLVFFYVYPPWNIAPENRPSQKESSRLPTIGAMLVLRSVNLTMVMMRVKVCVNFVCGRWSYVILLMDKILHHQGWWLSHYL